jgi:homoserine O-acetyltransferase
MRPERQPNGCPATSFEAWVKALQTAVETNPDQFALRRFELPVKLSGRARDSLPDRTRALLAGPDGAPLVIALGGISATAAVIRDEDGGPGWWTSAFGWGCAIDPAEYRILGIDFLADDSGRFAPSTYEQAAIIDSAIEVLGEQPHAVVGASYGGMVALAWAEQSKQTSTRLVLISANAEPHSFASAARSLQRRVVGLGLASNCASEALSIARGMGMLTYRTAGEFEKRFAGGLEHHDPLGPTDPGHYLEARGRSFVETMPPGRFLSLSASIDRHRVDVSKIANRALVVGVEEDLLVPREQCVELARRLAGPVRLELVHSLYGHDAFLKEPAIAQLIAGELKR